MSLPTAVSASAFLATFFCCSFSASSQVPQSEDASAQMSRDVESEFTQLFDGKTFTGWNGDSSVFRIEDMAIVGGQLKNKIPHNYFLECDRPFADFELRLQFKLKGKATNAGVQIRSQRIPDHHEMIGYQADLGQKYWGCLYDESRRRKVLAGPDLKKLDAILKRDDWNDYRIVCRGPRIQLFINGMKTVDFTEADSEIPLEGRIAVQIHGGPAGEAWYRNIRIREFKD